MKIRKSLDDLGKLIADFQSDEQWNPDKYDDSRRWSYGDVENNGVFYHPQLTHYAHQVFEQFFYAQRGIQYSDLSGREDRHQEIRKKHSPKILHRMTFPVGWLHQWMDKPMHAGDLFHTWIDTIDLSQYHLGVRAHIFNERDQHVAVVIWVRWARILEPVPDIVPIPEWFPRRERAKK